MRRPGAEAARRAALRGLRDASRATAGRTTRTRSTVTPDRPSPPNARDNARIGDLGRLTTLLDRLVEAGRLAPGLRDVWLTEYGYESHFYPGRPVFGLEEQAVFLTWAEYLSWRNPRVKTYAQFLLRDLPYTGPANPVRRPAGHWESGLLYADGRPKPMADAFVVGLHAARRADGLVDLWGRVRGVEEGEATIERRAGRSRRWRTVATGPVGGRTVPVPARAGREARPLPDDRPRRRPDPAQLRRPAR